MNNKKIKKVEKKMKIIDFTKTVIPMLLTSIVANAMSFSTNSNYMGYNLIYASGHIKKGDLKRLKNRYFSLDNKKQTVVVFNSNGGELYEGLKIGKFLKSHGIGSAVRKNGICASSCALAFLGGRSKRGKRLMILPYSSNLGLHSFYYKNGNYVRLSKVQSDLANILSYASYVGVPHYLMAKMFKTKSNNMYWLTQQDRVTLRLKSGISLKPTNGYLAYNKNTVCYSNYNSATNYIARYFSKINNLIASSRGSNAYSNDIAISSYKYKNWISKNMKYIHLKSVKALSSNKVEAKVIYSLNNGDRICSINKYSLAKRAGKWQIRKKIFKGCTFASSKKISKLVKALP